MLSNTASPMKRPSSIPIPQSMQKLIAKLQCPKKSSAERKSLARSRPHLLAEHHSFKKSKFDSTVKDGVEVLKTVQDAAFLVDGKFINSDVLKKDESASSSSSTKPFEGENKDLDQTNTFGDSDDERSFTYPRTRAPSKQDDNSTTDARKSFWDIASDSKNSAESNEDNIKLPVPSAVERKFSNLKSASKTSNVYKNKTSRKWVTFNDILQDTKRGSFVDELYNDDDDDDEVEEVPVDNQPRSDHPGISVPALKFNGDVSDPPMENDVQAESEPTDDISRELLDAIQRIRKINDMITKANEKICSSFTNGAVRRTH